MRLKDPLEAATGVETAPFQKPPPPMSHNQLIFQRPFRALQVFQKDLFLENRIEGVNACYSHQTPPGFNFSFVRSIVLDKLSTAGYRREWLLVWKCP